MLLYDIPLIKSSLSIKCLGGTFTKAKFHESYDSRTQQWHPRTNWQVIVGKTASFQLYKYRRSPKADKINMKLLTTTDVYGQICNIEICTVRIYQSRQHVDLVLVTLNTGELLVYHFSAEEKRFTCIYRDMIFKGKNQNTNKQNPRNVGNYITCSQQNHFLISSVRCHRRIYQVQATRYEQRMKVNVKPQETHVRQNHVCWNVIWMPSMINQSQYYGKYVCIEKACVTSQSTTNEHGMMDQKQERKHNFNPRKIRYYYVEKSYKVSQREERKEGYKKLQSTAHMLIALSSSSFLILYENSICLRELSNQTSKQQPKEQIIDMQFPIREALVDKNIQCMFASYSRQALEDKKNRIYIVNQFGDLFQIQYYLTGSLVANFNLRYINSVRTVHSIVYVGQVQNSVIRLGEQQPLKVRHESSSVILFGLERFSVALYFVFPSKTVQTKPKQTRVLIRPSGKGKAGRSYPEYSDKQSFKPIAQRSRDIQMSDQLQYMGAIIDVKVANLRGASQRQQLKDKQQSNQIFALTNGGNLRHQQHIDQTMDNMDVHRSHLKIIKKGLKIRQINSLQSPKLHQIYCFKKSQRQPHHRIVVLCMNGKTNLFTINNDALAYYKQLSFEESATSIYIGKFQDQSFVQIVGSKIRHIRKQKNATRDYPIKNKIMHAVSQSRQLFVALYGGQIIYFQLDRDKESLQQRKQFYVNDQVVSMQLTPLQVNKNQNGQQRKVSKYLIVGTRNYEIIVYRMTFRGQKQTLFELISSQNVKSPIQSISSTIFSPQQMSSISQKTYYIFLGMDNGSVIRMQLDKQMKKLGQKVLAIGSKPVKVKRTSINARHQTSQIFTSDKTYIYYIHKNKYKMHLLSCPNIDIATQMKQPQNPNTLLTFGERTAPSKDCLRIISIQTIGEDFHSQKVDLFFSGKKLLVFDNCVGIIEADPSYQKVQKNNHESDIDVQSNIIEIENLEKSWKSQFTIYKVKDAKKIAAIYFDQTKQVCLCAAYNHIQNGTHPGNYLIFGCAEGITYYPKFQAKQQTIKIYGWTVQKKTNQKQNQYKTQFLYSLNIDGIPLVIEPFFKGQKFLAGIGKSVRLFQIGRKKLLMKAQVKNLPSNVNQIKTIGKKIYVTSVCDSFHLFKYIPEEHTFYDIAQDQLPKFVTAMNILDSDTICAADKFGNLFIGRLTQNARSQFQNASGSSEPLNSGHLYKFNTLARVNVGQIVTSINKVCLYTSKVNVILYSTIMGQLRVLYPLTEYEQVKVLPLLQQKMRQKLSIPQFSGNNWAASKKVIQGQFVEKFLTLTDRQQKQILKDTEIIEEKYVDYLKDMIQGIRNKII